MIYIGHHGENDDNNDDNHDNDNHNFNDNLTDVAAVTAHDAAAAAAVDDDHYDHDNDDDGYYIVTKTCINDTKSFSYCMRIRSEAMIHKWH